MRIHKTIATRILLILTTALASSTPAAGGVALGRFVVASGGGSLSQGDQALIATLGQPAIGKATGGAVLFGAGFWYGGENLQASSIPDPESELPLRFRLDQNVPNPFNPLTRIRFATPKPGRVRLALYDVQGRRIRTLVDGDMPAGVHTVQLEATGLASGVYFYRLSAGDFHSVRKINLLN